MKNTDLPVDKSAAPCNNRKKGKAMDKLDIILWVVSAAFGIIFTLMMFMWHAMNSKFEVLDFKLDRVDSNLSSRIDKIDEKVTDIDRRLCRLEGAFSNKDCCMIKESNSLRKAE
jgi:hypothetical protein